MATHITTTIYGTIAGQPPYVGDADKQFANFNMWGSPAIMSLPTTGTNFHQVSPGYRVGDTTAYIYSIIEVLPQGLNQPSTKYASHKSVATLATDAS